jgi:hypothetical protein
MHRGAKYCKSIASRGERQSFVQHPSSSRLLAESQELLQKVLLHPSMPQTCDKTAGQMGADSKFVYTDVGYSSGNDDDESKKATAFRRAYMPPIESPLGRHLENIKKGIAVGKYGRQTIDVPFTNPLMTSLGNEPAPDKFYVYNRPIHI